MDVDNMNDGAVWITIDQHHLDEQSDREVIEWNNGLVIKSVIAAILRSRLYHLLESRWTKGKSLDFLLDPRRGQTL